LCDERYIRDVAGARDTGIDCAYLRLMTSNEQKGHTMKRTAVIVGIAAAMGVFAPVAAGAAGQSDGQAVVKPPVVKRTLPVKSALILHSAYNSRTGRAMYRLGNTGLWME
jgi:hypothetical protein